VGFALPRVFFCLLTKETKTAGGSFILQIFYALPRPQPSRSPCRLDSTVCSTAHFRFAHRDSSARLRLENHAKQKNVASGRVEPDVYFCNTANV
jgi:hypothetical protein